MTPEQTNMVVYLLSGMGEGLSPEGSPGRVGGGMAKGWAQSAQYMNLLKMMLGGMPAGSKMSGDRDNLSFKIPTAALAAGQGEDPFGVGSLQLSPEVTKPYQPQSRISEHGFDRAGISPSQQGYTNPFVTSSPQISSAAVAGLTTEDISKALQLKFMKEEIGQKRISDVADIMYKGRMATVAEREAAVGERGAGVKELGGLTELVKSLRTSPLDVPGLGKISFDEWKSLDSKTKAYSYYAYDAKQRKEEVISYNEWERQLDPTTIEQIYELAMEDEDFMKFFFKQKKAGATRISIGEVVGRAEALADVKAEKFLTDPRGLSAAVDKYMNSEDLKNKLFDLEGDAYSRAVMKEKADFIEGKIKGIGSVDSVRMEGRTRIWTVRRKDGTTFEVRYGF